nr:hypothetical protein [Tanacetum cinerariifolium]
MDDPNITMEEYIRLEEQKAQKHGKVFNWKLQISSLNNNEIGVRISFDESDNKDYMIVFDKNSFSYKIISTNDLKMDFENDNEEVNKPLFPSPKPKDLAKRMRMIYTRDDGQEDQGQDEVTCGWDFLRGAPSYTYIRDLVRRLCHKLISYNIFGRGQAPEKSGARLSGGHFIRRLAHHFGLVSDDGLKGLLVVALELSLIDMVDECTQADPAPAVTTTSSCSSLAVSERRTRQRTGEASTFAAPQQPDI